jgi:hypothetical protein
MKYTNRAGEGGRGKTTMRTKDTIGAKEYDSKSFGKWRPCKKPGKVRWKIEFIPILDSRLSAVALPFPSAPSAPSAIIRSFSSPVFSTEEALIGDDCFLRVFLIYSNYQIENLKYYTIYMREAKKDGEKRWPERGNERQWTGR